MTFYIYKDAKGEWRWRLKHKGRIMADSGEGYSRRNKCRHAIERIMLRASSSMIVVA